MIFIKVIFCSILPFQAAYAASVTKASPSGVSVSTKYNHMHFNYYSPENKKTKARLLKIENWLADMQKRIDTLTGKNPKLGSRVMKNCAELYKSGQRISGVYTIDPDGLGSFDVFCDQKTAGGGWTVFQKRLDGSVNFIRGWNNYKRGFGNLKSEFWLGLDKINRLTKTKSKLRVELEDWKGKSAHAEYSFFAVSSERTKYKLSLGTYSGTAGDSMAYQRGSAFSTKDRDNDNYHSSCSVAYKGPAWWFNSCVRSTLNGIYYKGRHSSSWSGVNWYSWKGANYSAKRAEMKIRPVDF